MWEDTSRKLQWALRAGSCGDTRNAYRLVVKKPVVKCPIGLGTKEGYGKLILRWI
jgi:hypothetical protein